MFHITVEPIKREMSELQSEEDNDYKEVFLQPFDQECVEFSVGNPRVEHITGIVHLYKRSTVPYGSSAALQGSSSHQQASPGQAASGGAPDVSSTVCCLAIPADMSVAHFCSFIGAYLNEVRSIQVLRREGTQPSVCMVLLSFSCQDKADSFYADFNGLPFSSLEPDILCRLVFVRSVEVLSARGRPTLTLTAGAAAAAAAGMSAKAPAAAAAGPGKAEAAAAEASAGAETASSRGSSSKEGKPVSDSSSPEAAGSTDATAASAAADKSGSASSSRAAAAALQAAASSEIEAAEGLEAAAAPAEGKPAASSSTATQDTTPAPPAAAGSEGQQQSYAAAAAAGISSNAATGSSPAAAAGGAVAVAAAAAPFMLWLEPPPGTTELPTCPVCLERLDEHISGIVTTVCNHRFHGECLKRWGDTSCPVCRYCMYSSNASTSRCSTCGTNANLWICLICGHVGCGRYKAGHASDHWQASAHCYALELETQRVWDYAGDGYVHRLIQSKTDGKLVEVPSPAPQCSHSSSPGHNHHHHNRNRRSHASRRLDRTHSGCSGGGRGPGEAGTAGPGGYAGSGGDSDSCGSSSCPMCADEQQQMKDVMVSSKLDAITLEYNYLLTTQLDSQRQYFEGLLAQQEARQQQTLAAAQAAAEQAIAARAAATAAAKESDRKRQQLERKLSELSCSVSKVGEEREFLRSLNETLLANQKEYGCKLKAAQAALADKEAAVTDLQEQVRDLMVYIEAQRTIQSSGELAEATLLPVPAKEGSSSGRRRSSKK